MNRIYMCIDLKSFFASVECRERNLDPLNTNLVVADSSRTEKTVCLAVTPSLKQYGIGGRARLYEVIQKVKKVNQDRSKLNNYNKFKSKSCFDSELKNNKELELDFIIAPPRMSKYIKYSTDIYNTYLKYLSKDDIFVYSIDEVFCDITDYIKLYKLTPKELATKMIYDVYNKTGITATAGIGTNLYLAKIAMDIVAKHKDADEFGVRIAELDETSYRKELWDFRPLTKFWRIGPGIAKKLESIGIYTQGDIARCSIENEKILYKMFGVNAELIIDHAWGYEPCTVESVKKYKPSSSSISSGQVLHEPYDYKKTKLIIKEMADVLALNLVSKNYKTNQIVMTIGYDIDNLKKDYDGEIVLDYYGRTVPKSSHGTINIPYYSSSSKTLIDSCVKLFEDIIDKKLLVRRINLTANNLLNEEEANKKISIKQFDLFSNQEDDLEIIDKVRENEQKDNKVQKVILNIKNKYGKNAILKGMNYMEGGTTKDRNRQIGGHKE